MARENLKIKVGTYTGTGANATISGVGFKPKFVLIKGVSQHPVFRIHNSLRSDTCYLDSAAANIAGAILQFNSDGFLLDDNAVVNGNGVAFHYVAVGWMDSQQYFRTGKYSGTGIDDRNITGGGFSFTPGAVLTKRNGATTGAFRTSVNSGDSSGSLSGSFSTNKLQNLQSNGFQVGTNDAVNNNGSEYNFIALRELSGVIKIGSYTGTGSAKSITGVGFQPDFILVKDITGNRSGVLWTSAMTAGQSFQITNGTAITTGVTAAGADGFSISTGTGVNEAASTYMYLAMKAGSFFTPISRASA